MIKKAVITAAGRGTRMYPASQSVQKELFPLMDTDGYCKPTLQIIVEEALASGIEEICIVCNPSNLAPIGSHFHGLSSDELAGQFAGKEWARPLSDSLREMSERLSYVVQTTQEGYGHAVYQARKWVGDDPFLLLLGDHVYHSFIAPRCARQVMDAFHGSAVSSALRAPEEVLGRMGTMKAEPVAVTPGLYRVLAMTEKPTVEYARENLRTPGLPEGKYLCFFGIHAFPASVFECLEELIRDNRRYKGEIQLTSAQELLSQREPYFAAEVQGERYDMGVPEGLAETQLALAMLSPHRRHIEEFFNRR